MATSRPRMTGIGRVLVIVYAIMALAATGRSFVQIVQDFAAAPVAYTLSALAAVVYILATLALVKSDSPAWYTVAWIAICFELAGVLVVGTLSLTHPELFAHDATVWSGYGYGYFWIPLVLPSIGIWWLVTSTRTQPVDEAVVGRLELVIIFREPSEVPAGFGPSVVAIGKFDGVHSGHRAVIDRARVAAADTGARVVAVTFDRNPLSVLRPELCPAPLVSLDQKLHLLADEGIDAVLVLRFDAALAALEPRAFVEHVLVDALDVVTLMVGDDFRFGRGGAGDPELLIAMGAEFGFTVDVVGDVQGGGRRVSSTWVRALLDAGDVESAARLLGRPHAVQGEVVHGLKRGRELGFPTANLSADAEGFIPADGVYAGWLIDEGPAAEGGQPIGAVTRYPAAISVGTNPTFDDVPVRQVEAFVLDETALDLYGHRVQIQFTHRIRGMLAFDGVEQLIARMDQDVAEVRRLLA